ncbi:site-specific integrase [Turicibacter sanguinis]|uniref:site-specific integrase n=1 Tax=Turicibacter sanguinis TaxID=154288 RepID=UPI001898A0C0|nr:tyrosine-type recombinase/integrase [Turicibacter sanguinis]
MKGSVYKRGSTWSYYYKYKQDGAYKKKEKGGFKTKKDAQHALREALVIFEKQGLVQAATTYTIEEYINYWMENVAEIKLRYNTLDLYRRAIRLHINPEIGFLKLNNIKADTLQTFFTTKQKALSDSYINAIRNILNGTFKLAIKQSLILFNPMHQLELHYSKVEKNLEIITTEHLKIILDDISNTRYYIPFIISLHTGARRGEILALTWDDIHFETRKITFNKSLLAKDGEGVSLAQTKTKSSIRTILMTQKLITELQQWQDKQNQNKQLYAEYYYTEHDFVCSNEDGTPINPKRFSTQINRISKRLNIPIKFHNLRHTHATLLLESDVNIKVIQERLGHSDISTTLNVYSHVTQKTEAEAIAKFESNLNI